MPSALIMRKGKQMLRRTRIIWNCIFISLAVFCVSWWAWQKSFHLKTLVSNGETVYEPGFYYSSPSGPLHRTAFRRIQAGHLRQGNKEYIQEYGGAYPTEAENTLKERGYEEFFGQLMHYRHYQDKEIYVYDNWYEEKLFWKIFVVSGETVKEFQVAKTETFDSVTNCTADDKYIYLQLNINQALNGDNMVIVIVRIEIATGAQETYRVEAKDFGNIISRRGSWFDPRTERLIALTYGESRQKELQAYSFRTGEKKTIVLEKPASWVLASEDGYLLVNANSGRIIFYAYDLDWNPAPEKDIEIPLVNIADVRRLKPLASRQIDESVHLADGIVYGCIEGENALWYYAVDLEAQKVVALWEVQHPKGKLYLQSHLLFHKETGCEPYPTLF